ncbi:MAG: GTPase ObgE [Fimbriimonadaceae bacterium]
MFLDEAVVEFISGKGGNGSATFHREKHVPRGGPNGADGGRGGDVLLIADHHMRTLYDFRLHPKYKAEDGSDAHGNKAGSDGKHVEVRVPVGTLVWEIPEEDPETPILLADLHRDGMSFKICRGGKGGFGNLHFVSSVRQVPTFAERGAPAESVRAKLELKLLADVGLVGLPNAGKSTLISRISAAKPKIADYPFTTIVPNLGVVSFSQTSFTVADMPGLIEGAHEGHGLGHQFLRHVERTRVLIHVVDVFPVDESDPIGNYELIERELKLYSEDIWKRPRLIALNKIDILQPEEVEALAAKFGSVLDSKKVFPISAVTGAGLEPLLYETVRLLEEAEAQPQALVLTPLGRETEPDKWEIIREGGNYRIKGKRIERMVAMTDLTKDEAVRYLHKRLLRLGVMDRLRESGADEGDTVLIGDVELVYEE